MCAQAWRLRRDLHPIGRLWRCHGMKLRAPGLIGSGFDDPIVVEIGSVSGPLMEQPLVIRLSSSHRRGSSPGSSAEFQASQSVPWFASPSPATALTSPQFLPLHHQMRTERRDAAALSGRQGLPALQPHGAAVGTEHRVIGQPKPPELLKPFQPPSTWAQCSS